MKTITLRNLPERVARKIEERAKQTGASYNRTVVSMLEESITDDKPKEHHDLDFLHGTWTQEEADEFDRILAEQRQIDWELWK